MNLKAALAVQLLVVSSCLGSARRTIVLPISKANLVGVRRATTQSTQGQVAWATGFQNDKQFISFSVDSPGGMYRAEIEYRTKFGKGFELRVNGLAYSGFFNGSKTFKEHDAGLIELPPGHATIQIGGGWGHYDISGLTLVPAIVPPPPHPSSRALCNPNATPQAKLLFKNLLQAYGHRTLSGVYSIADLKYVHRKVGCNIAILGNDLGVYSPAGIPYGANGHGQTEKIIAQAKQERIITLCWHWTAPAGLINVMKKLPDGKIENDSWYRGFYTKATAFDFAKAIDDPSSENYKLMLRDMDAIAVQLRKYQDAGIPVLWRPLHEADGTWFWWGSKGPKPFVKLWRLMYHRLTDVDHLNNLIWVYSTGGSPEWYPGDDMVDIVGADTYPKDNRDPLTGIWNTLLKQFGSRKLLALTEVGMVPNVDRMFRHGVYWSFYNTWLNQHGPRGMTAQQLRRRLLSSHVQNNPFRQEAR